MKKILPLSLTLCALLSAAQLKTIEIEATTINELGANVVESADLADAISNETPGVTMIRRSGISNDVILRGQKRDNIAVTVDDTKVFGACPNRMDPPTSHVITSNIESVSIVDGPYDVENFGTMSGGIKVSTKAPQKDIHGSVDLSAGSFGQNRASGTITGGNDTVRLLLTATAERSGQYEDGNGDSLADQVDNYVTNNPTVAGMAFKPTDHDMRAYNKISYLGKVHINLAENHLLKLSATQNESRDILYPSSPMDAIEDDSTIYDVEYVATDLSDFSKEFVAKYYHSHVWHPMSNAYRKSSAMGVMSNELTTDMDGARIKNSMDVTDNMELSIGADYSMRNWDGDYKKNGAFVGTSITSTDTENMALFASTTNRFGDFQLDFGARFDATSVTPEAYNRAQGIVGSNPWQSNDYTGISANIMATYALNESVKVFGGLGRGHRVPDARELYILGKPISTAGDPNMGKQVQMGTPDLDATTNHQVDLGAEYNGNMLQTRAKLFYNMLNNYIYYNATKMGANKFANIDATIYGAELSASLYVMDNAYFDLGVAYQRGEKDEALAGQSDKNLADIPPLKGTLAFTYEYAANSYVKVEGVAADTWSDFDADNGEQEIVGYAIMNLKLNHRFESGFGFAAGIDNVLDKVYAVSNTYKDLTLITGDANSDVIMLNEPGRSYYFNVSYLF
jgi:iron complex outermembrane recepter protein